MAQVEVETTSGLGGALEEEHPGLDVRFDVAGNSALAQQMVQGAFADGVSASGLQLGEWTPRWSTPPTSRGSAGPCGRSG